MTAIAYPLDGDEISSMPVADNALSRGDAPKGGKAGKAGTSVSEIEVSDKDGGADSPSISPLKITDLSGLDERKKDVLALIFGTSYDPTHHESHSESDRKLVLLSPKDARRAKWDAVFIMAVLFSLFYWPLWCAFLNGQVTVPWVLDKIVNVICLADVVLNFHTGFDDSGTIENRVTYVRRHYLYNRFTIDLISSLPFDIFMFFSDSLRYEHKALIFRLESIIRIMCRLPRLVAYFGRWEDNIRLDANFLRVSKLVFIILLFSHVNACIQYLSARIEEFPDESWVVRNDLLDDSDHMKYTVALFNALSHMLCIGYGSHGRTTAPQTDAEVFITILSMVVGASFYVVLVGIIASIVLSMDHSGAAYKEKIDIWRQYSQYRQLPKDIRDRVFKYFEHRWHTRKVFDENVLLSQLPRCLSSDIKMFRSEYLLNRVPIFKLCHPAIVRTVVSHLKPMSCLEDEVVYTFGQMAEEMYFILKGEVQIIGEPDYLITALSDGSYFGEFPLIFEEVKTRTATAKCTKWTTLYCLMRMDFVQIVEVYPELLSVMRQIAEARKVHSSSINVVEAKEIGEDSDEIGAADKITIGIGK